MLHGPQHGRFDLIFRVPSVCADLVANGQAQIGILPVFELLTHDFGTVPGVGIASRGAVRSILLVSKVAASRIQTLAADTSSRTSVALARVWLAERHGLQPAVLSHAPDLPAMLAQADAALVIGDPALRLDPASLPYDVYDLGHEWTALTGLPMVYAMWAGPRHCLDRDVVNAFQESARYGVERVGEIATREGPARGISVELARRYLTKHIVCELGEAEMQGLDRFLTLVSAVYTAASDASVTI
jgi:predicted solute-binding protein